MDLARYAELFLSESREHLEHINASLLALEQGGGAEADRSEAVDALFRSVHTIKGMSAAMGYAGVADLSHTMESLLDGMRSGRVAITDAALEAMFQGADALDGAIDSASRGLPDPSDVSVAIDRLTEVSRTDRGGADPAASRDAVVLGGPATTTSAPQASHAGGERRQTRIAVQRLDALMAGIGELVIVRGRLAHLTSDRHDPALGDAMAALSRQIGELQEEILSSRMVQARDIFDRFPRLVRDGARALGKEIDLVMRGQDIELDRAVLDGIGEPIVHLLRNAIDHGIETPSERALAGKPPRGRLELSAERDRTAVLIRVSDDGRGVDHQRVIERARELHLIEPDVDELSDELLFRLIARPGFSTAKAVTDVSGRGVGVDAVHARVRSLGGSVEMRTVPGEGTTMTLRLPLTLAIMRALLIASGAETYALPLAHVRETLELEDAMLRSQDGREAIAVRESVVPLRRARDLVGLARDDAVERFVVLLEIAERRVALAVDDLVEQEDIVVKQFDPVRDAPPLFGGATILADGAPALIFDVGSLV
jgi:two-component system chemotaxis sensor kinase CheA